jgi:hypothetical protein
LKESLNDLDNTVSFVSEKMNNFPVPVLLEAVQGTDFLYKEVPEINEEVVFFFDQLKNVYPESVGNLNYENLFYKK